MVLSEVRKNPGIEFHSAHTVLNECVAGNFHGNRPSASVTALGQDLLEIDRFWRCVRCRALLACNDVFHGSNQARMQTCRIKKVLRKKGARGFAIRACDSYAFERAVWMIVKFRRDIGHGCARVWNKHYRAVGFGWGFFRNDSSSTSLDSLRDKCSAIGFRTRQSEE
jgi:hypothetical protein